MSRSRSVVTAPPAAGDSAMSRAVLSIGSNIGDRNAALRLAVAAFRPWLVAVSPVYETAPWGPVPQHDFHNAVLIADDPDAAPADLRQLLRRPGVREQLRALLEEDPLP